MNKLQMLLSRLSQSEELANLRGVDKTPDEVKRNIIELFSPYIRDADLLDRIAIGALAPLVPLVARVGSQDWSFDLFEFAFFSHRRAIEANGNDAVAATSAWFPQMLRSRRLYWTLMYVELDKRDLDTDEFVFECARNLGTLIEGVSKPFLMHLLHHVTIGAHESTSFDEINAMDLGKVAEQLERQSGNRYLLSPPPWRLRLNQWRNIAQHLSITLDGDAIVCSYGFGPRTKLICLKRNEFLEVAHAASLAFVSINLASILFVYDNAQQVSDKLPSTMEDYPIEERIVTLISAIATQGFITKDFQLSNAEAKLVAVDTTSADPLGRAIHASQFLFPLWNYTHASLCIVEYWDYADHFLMRSEVDSDACEQFSRCEIELADYAAAVRFLPQEHVDSQAP